MQTSPPVTFSPGFNAGVMFCLLFGVRVQNLHLLNILLDCSLLDMIWKYSVLSYSSALANTALNFGFACTRVKKLNYYNECVAVAS